MQPQKMADGNKKYFKEDRIAIAIAILYSLHLGQNKIKICGYG